MCEQFIAFLADYLDGLLAPDVAARFETHLEGCRSCTAYLETYAETIRMVRAVTTAPMLSEAPEELIAAILAATR